MRGIVKLVNTDDGVVAVETEHGEYTVFGLLEDSAVDVGDVIVGKLESLDQQIFRNETKSTEMTVYVEDVEITREEAETRV